MSGDKETPRQAMIGMMYLVLLALLAMNVSKSVLNSFIVINGAMEETNTAFDAKNGETLSAFENQYGQNPEKVGEFYFAAKRVVESSEELSDYMEHLKRHIIEHTAGKSPEETWPDSLYNLTNVEAVDNIDAPSHVLLGSDEMNPISGEFTMLELKDKIKEWKRIMLAEVPERQKATYNLGFNYNKVKQTDGSYLSWELAHFYHAPLAAVITDITIFQTQVKNRESEVLKMLMSNISAKDFKFDKIAVKVIPNSNYVVLGDSFKADVIVAAYSTTETPIMEVGSRFDSASNTVIDPVDQSRISVENGVAKYGYKPTSTGEITWGGIIKLKKPGTDNEFEIYSFEHTFIAAEPSTVVSPTAMNILYKAVENPVSVSVGGFASTDVSITVSGGTSKGSAGEYMITPNSNSRECIVNVTVKGKDGKSKPMGKQVFRVKRLPDPNVKFATIIGSGKATKGQIKASKSVKVDKKEMLFDGIKYKVVSFDMVFPSSKGSITISGKGDKITAAMKGKIGGLRKGQTVIIKSVRLQLNNDKPRAISSNIIIEVK